VTAIFGIWFDDGVACVRKTKEGRSGWQPLAENDPLIVLESLGRSITVPFSRSILGMVLVVLDHHQRRLLLLLLLLLLFLQFLMRRIVIPQTTTPTLVGFAFLTVC
jgi:hypothetical protein